MRYVRDRRARHRPPGVPDSIERLEDRQVTRRATLPRLLGRSVPYVLDLWFSRRVRKACQGEAYYFRFADDFLACFQYKGEAERFRQQLEDRLEGFGLRLAAEKTQCLEFGRFARRHAYKRGTKPKEFTFLGFTHYCGTTRDGYYKVKRRTSRKKLGQSLQRFTDWARRARSVLTGRAAPGACCVKERCSGWPAPAWSATCATTPSRITRPHAESTYAVLNASCSPGSTARASGGHIRGPVLSRPWPRSAGPRRVSAST